MSGESLLVDHGRDDDRLEKHSSQPTQRLPHGIEIILVVLDLPYTDKAHHPVTSRRLDRQATVIPRFIGEKNSQGQSQAADPEGEPEDDAPVACAGVGEVAEEGRRVGSDEEDGGPDA